MGLIDKLQSKLELYRLEQRYTRRKNRQTFTTGAQYVDGEYIYTGAATGNSHSNSSSTATSPTSSKSWTGSGGKFGGWGHGSTRR